MSKAGFFHVSWNFVGEPTPPTNNTLFYVRNALNMHDLPLRLDGGYYLTGALLSGYHKKGSHVISAQLDIVGRPNVLLDPSGIVLESTWYPSVSIEELAASNSLDQIVRVLGLYVRRGDVGGGVRYTPKRCRVTVVPPLVVDHDRCKVILHELHSI